MNDDNSDFFEERTESNLGFNIVEESDSRDFILKMNYTQHLMHAGHVLNSPNQFLQSSQVEKSQA